MSTKHILLSSNFSFFFGLQHVQGMISGLEVKTQIQKNKASSCMVKLVNSFWSVY